MNPSKFDELTKELAKSTSRRHALRTILTVSLSSLFGLGALRSVFGRNDFCANWCAQVFGDTRAAGQCTSDAAHGRGVCFTCGNVAPSSICCVRNTSGFCNSGSVVVGCSCDSSQCQTCDTSSGTCVGCPSGQTCISGTCCDNANVCGSSCLTAPCSNSCATCDSGTGTCVCPPGTVLTANGTCAQPCPVGGCASGR